MLLIHTLNSTSLQVSVDPNWDASNNDFSTYKPWTKADGSVDHDKYLEKLKAQENGYGGYYTYYDILHYIIPNIEIAIRNLKKVDEKKEDYVKDWETNWDLYGTSELDALNKKYTEELEKVQDYAKPWSELTDEEKRANSGNEDSYNIYHNKYVEIYGYISANGTLTAAIAKRNQEKEEAQKILDGYNSQMSDMKKSASINNADYGFTDEDKTVIYSLFHDQDYQNNNIVSTSVDTSVIRTGSSLTCKSTSTFTGSLKAGSFTFRDYSEIDDNNIIYRRPVASAGSNKSRVAILQGTSNNKIIIKAQYNSTNFTNVTFTGSSSDVRLKKDIKDSSVNALSKIMQMQIREFNWKQTGVHQELGCVADELELIDPLLTVGGGYDDDGTMNIKSIDTLLLSEYAIKGIQELYRQNKQQQKRIEYLELQLNNK